MAVNIKSISFEGDMGLFEGTIILFVPNLDVLNVVQKKVSLIPGIQEVQRIMNF
jgi:hypothetical protein